MQTDTIEDKKEKMRNYQKMYKLKNKKKFDMIKEESKTKTLLYKETVKCMKNEEFLKKQELKIQKKKETAIRRKNTEHLRYINRKKLKEDTQIELLKIELVDKDRKIELLKTELADKDTQLNRCITPEDDFIELFIDKFDYDEFEKDVDLSLTNIRKPRDTKTYSKEYYEKNKEKIKKNNKEYHRNKQTKKFLEEDIHETIRDEINKYNDGKIYKLIHFGKMIYIGSTTLPINIRLDFHKSSSENIINNSNLYKYIRECNSDDIFIELIENYKC